MGTCSSKPSDSSRSLNKSELYDLFSSAISSAEGGDLTLLQSDIDLYLNIKEPGSERTLLHEFARSGNFRAAEYLLENGADPLENSCGMKPIYLAALTGKEDVVNLLVRHSNITDEEDLSEATSSICIAATSRHINIFKILAKFFVENSLLDFSRREYFLGEIETLSAESDARFVDEKMKFIIAETGMIKNEKEIYHYEGEDGGFKQQESTIDRSGVVHFKESDISADDEEFSFDISAKNPKPGFRSPGGGRNSIVPKSGPAPFGQTGEALSPKTFTPRVL